MDPYLKDFYAEEEKRKKAAEDAKVKWIESTAEHCPTHVPGIEIMASSWVMNGPTQRPCAMIDHQRHRDRWPGTCEHLAPDPKVGYSWWKIKFDPP